MAREPLFAGLIVDELDRAVAFTLVGDEPCYIVDDQGFKRHIPSAEVDRQVLNQMRSLIEGQEDLIGEQAAKMLGQDDIFSIAMLTSQLKDMDKQFEAVLDTGLPENARAYLGMLGFQVRINMHGEVLDVRQPGVTDPGDEE